MSIDFDSLVAYEDLIANPERILKKVEVKGKIVILKNNKPVYVVGRFDEFNLIDADGENQKKPRITLHEAMKIVLEEKENKTMHADEIADAIYKRNLYLKKDGTRAGYNQVRARCSHYPEMFETLPGNMIRLIKESIE